MKLIYKIEMLSDWHCGSGLTSGADVDLLCIKDENGLPIIPGRTLKGLLKESAKYFYEFDSNLKKDWKQFITDCFGEQTDKQIEEESSQSEKGECFFSNASLTGKIIKEIKDKPEKKEILFRKISSTAIDENGEAKEHSLRKMEVVIPLTLFAVISELPNDYKDQMENCLKLVKRLGTNRNRGLGRCKLSIKEVK